MNESSNKMFAYGFAVITSITCFTWFFSYINEPIGDDVLCYFSGSLTYYLDEFDNTLGAKLTSISQILAELKFVYVNWSGRIVGYTFQYFGKLLPELFQSLLTALIFSSNIFLAMRVVLKKSKKVIESPLAFGLIYLVMYWFRPSTYFTWMWTMVSINSLAVLLGLLYYNLAIIDKNEGKIHKIWHLQIIGLLAGFSHEVISLCIIAIIGFSWIIEVIKKQRKWTSLLMHTGLGVGYLLCFLAPGNFNRARQSHDIITASFIERLKNSWVVHKEVIIGTKGAYLVLFVALILAYTSIIILTTKKNYAAIKVVLNDTVCFMVGGVFSIALWAMAPRVPAYGLDLWILVVCIVLFRFTIELRSNLVLFKRVSFRIAAPIVIMILFIVLNASELLSYTRTSFARRNLVRNSVKSGYEDVVVPRFSDNLSTERYLLVYLNDQHQYDTNYYIEYYGIRLIIDNN